MSPGSKGFDPEQFFGPEGPFGPRGPLGPGGVFGPQGPFGTGGGWSGLSGLGGLGNLGQAAGWGASERRGPRGGGRRARRGDVRSAILELLSVQGPSNGYQLMQGISEATDGAWAPSSGAIYPALAQLEDEGLIEEVATDGRKAYQLTEAGREAAVGGPSLLWGERSTGGREPEDPWRESGEHRPHGSHGRGSGGAGDGRHGGRRTGGTLWKAVGSLAMATQAVGQAGDDELTARATDLLDRTRRDLYRMLAEFEVGGDDHDDDHSSDSHDRTDDRDDTAEEITEGEIVED